MEETFKEEQCLMLPFFENLRNDEQFTDVVLVTNDGTKFSCHKIILMARCLFFRGLFRSEMIETRQAEVFLKQVEISGPDFNMILKFIYTGEITLNFENAKVINIYSGFFSISKLKNFSETFLIKNITNETCLELWRHSDKYLCDNLKNSCLITASTELFLDAHIDYLTLEEIKSIASFQERKCTSKALLKNIAKWIKKDFETRQQYITDLMDLINFNDIMMISDKEFKNHFFSDEVLMQNKEFLTLTVKYFIRQNAVNLPNKKLFVVTKPCILYTDFERKNFIKTLLIPSESNYFGLSCHTTNSFILTGGAYYGPVNSCALYCPSTNKKRDFPALVEARTDHKSYTVGSKIYTCAGEETNTVEVYDEIAEKWIYGPAMDTNLFDFGSADDNQNSLYAVCGRIKKNSFSDSISHLDTRTKTWQIIYRDPLIKFKCIQSLLQDNKIYSFGTDEGFIYDIRAKKKLLIVPYKLDNGMSFTFKKNLSGYGLCYDCTIIDSDIWLFGDLITPDNTVIDAVRLNWRSNQFERQRFNRLDYTTSYLGLVWCT